MEGMRGGKGGGGSSNFFSSTHTHTHTCSQHTRYAPSLRQLRQHALVLFFPPTITSRLAGRLLQVSRIHLSVQGRHFCVSLLLPSHCTGHLSVTQVSKKEHMSAAMSTMMALCEKSDSDIRSCLNTLQVGIVYGYKFVVVECIHGCLPFKLFVQP